MDASGGVRARAYRAYVLALLVTVGIVGWVDRNVFAVLLQSIKADLALSDTELGLLGGVAFGVFYAGVGLPVAWLADRFSRSSLIAVALGLWSVMTAACGLAGGFASLFLARVGVGVGEAGGSPPSQSLIADYFPPARRARALGVFYLYIPCGFVAGYLSGGWLNELVGWRLTFLIVGVPGVLLALVVRFTLLEPPRGHADGARDVETVPDLVSTIRYFLGCPTLRHLPLAGAVHGIGAFAAAVWLPAYFMRTFEVTSATAGAWMAIAYGCGGSVGVLCGGHIADAIVRRTGDPRWYAWGCAGVILATLPCTVLLYLTHDRVVAVGVPDRGYVAWPHVPRPGRRAAAESRRRAPARNRRGVLSISREPRVNGPRARGRRHRKRLFQRSIHGGRVALRVARDRRDHYRARVHAFSARRADASPRPRARRNSCRECRWLNASPSGCAQSCRCFCRPSSRSAGSLVSR